MISLIILTVAGALLLLGSGRPEIQPVEIEERKRR